LEILHELKKLGVTVHPMGGKFDWKVLRILFLSSLLLFQHGKLTEIMKSYKNSTDFLIPIDIDEFIGFVNVQENNVALSLDKEKILGEFSNLPRDRKPYKFIFSLSKPLDCEDENHTSNLSPPTLCSSRSFYIFRWWELNKEEENNVAREWKYETLCSFFSQI
jgi:hypothetical protein